MTSAVALHIEQHGRGRPTVVLLHGFAGSARNFGPQVRFLREHHHIVTFDLRGHARSEAPEDPSAYEPQAFVEDVGRVLQEVNAETCVLGGVSMGASIALRFALAQPSAVRGLLLASFPPKGDASTSSWAMRFANALDERGSESAGEEFVWGGARYDAAAARLIRQGFVEHSPHALASILRRTLAVMPSVDEIDGLKKIDVPTTIVVGENDTPSRGPSTALADAIHGAELIVMPSIGHVVNLENTNGFNAITAKLLSRF